MKRTKRVKLTPVVNYDQNSNQFEILLDELGIYSRGISKQDALDSLLDTVKDRTHEFFYNFDFYSDIPEFKSKYPYFFSFGRCKTREEFIEVLNLVKF